MVETGPASEHTPNSTGSPASIGRVIGWAMTALGALVIVVTVAVTLYLMVSAESGIEFAGWFFTMLFFGGFPALMGLGLIIWGGRIVRRSRSG